MWVVVDDGSTDDTLEKLHRLEPDLGFMTVMQAPPSTAPVDPRDRLASAAAPRTFNAGLHSVGWQDYTHIGKLDGDVELPPTYYRDLLAQFAADDHLGIACGELIEYRDGRPHRLHKAAHHVHGAFKTYSIGCFQAIGGVRETLGWDTIDETYARMRGYRTGSVLELEAVHHRPAGSADGTLRGRARHGQCAYIAHYGPVWVALRSLRIARTRPVAISGAAFLYGYVRAAARRTRRVEDPEFRRYARSELRGRMLGALRLARSGGGHGT
jgi:hypothetical protein